MDSHGLLDKPKTPKINWKREKVLPKKAEKSKSSPGQKGKGKLDIVAILVDFHPDNHSVLAQTK